MEIKLEKPYLTRLQFIDCAKFMVSSFSNLNDGFVEGSCEIKCKHGNDKKKCETVGMKYKYCECFFNTQTLNMI